MARAPRILSIAVVSQDAGFCAKRWYLSRAYCWTSSRALECWQIWPVVIKCSAVASHCSRVSCVVLPGC